MEKEEWVVEKNYLFLELSLSKDTIYFMQNNLIWITGSFITFNESDKNQGVVTRTWWWLYACLVTVTINKEWNMVSVDL